MRPRIRGDTDAEEGERLVADLHFPSSAPPSRNIRPSPRLDIEQGEVENASDEHDRLLSLQDTSPSTSPRDHDTGLATASEGSLPESGGTSETDDQDISDPLENNLDPATEVAEPELPPGHRMIIVKTPADQRIPLAASESETTAQVLARLTLRDDIQAESPSELKLLFGGRVLSPVECLLTAGVQADFVLILTYVPKRSPGATTNDGGISTSVLPGTTTAFLYEDSDELTTRREHTVVFIIGFLLGLMMGILGLLFICDPRVPRSGRAGGILGIGVSMTTTLSQAHAYDPNQRHSDHPIPNPNHGDAPVEPEDGGDETPGPSSPPGGGSPDDTDNAGPTPTQKPLSHTTPMSTTPEVVPTVKLDSTGEAVAEEFHRTSHRRVI